MSQPCPTAVLTPLKIPFNTLLEMRHSCDFTQAGCSPACFQYSIGDARLHCGASCRPPCRFQYSIGDACISQAFLVAAHHSSFNTLLEMPRPRRRHSRPTRRHRLSILYWRCLVVGLNRQLFNIVLSILYWRCLSRRSISRLVLSILYWRCGEQIPRGGAGGRGAFNTLLEMRCV